MIKKHQILRSLPDWRKFLCSNQSSNAEHGKDWQDEKRCRT